MKGTIKLFNHLIIKVLKASLTPANKEGTIYWLERNMEAKYRNYT